MNTNETPAQEFVYYRSYSRWVEEKGRRETWSESVQRYFDFMQAKFETKVPKKVWNISKQAVVDMEVMPSMRALWGAGPALEQNNIIGYNCACVAFSDLQAVVELFYILMCGTGVGFTIESEYISKMPVVARPTGIGRGIHVVGDSREGWATALKVGLEAWFEGDDLEFDFSRVRPRGARLKTMGGRASGPAPLKKLLDFAKGIILSAQDRRLTSVEWLDIGNMVGEVVVVGGVRRSSEITFSDLDDEGLRHAKDYSRGPVPQHRGMSNNSVAYFGRPDMVTFLREWAALAASGSGERGIYNVKAAMEASPRRTVTKFNKSWEELGRHLRTNPCGEINLLVHNGGEFCNLTEVVVRAYDTFATLQEKVKTAVWLGAMQACLTDFPFLRPGFKETCEEERLLGVSLTGQMDNPKLMTADRLADLKEVAIRECRKACKHLGINMSAAITTGKPSGTVSQRVNCASGAHPRHSRWYIRRYRINATDPLYKMMRDQGIKFSPENGQGPKDVERRRAELETKGRSPQERQALVPDWTPESVTTWVVEFPEAAPAKALTRHNLSAIEMLEWYLKLKKNWCEHNQSITIYVRDSEWLQVGAWVYDHFDEISGVSFLPFDGGKYEQAPYEDITEEEYKRRAKEFPKIDYGELGRYEQEDNTTGAQMLACSSGGCELI